jgi:phosphate transport system ATP-binding protein
VVRDLDVWYGAFQALQRVSLDVPPRGVTALIGPSGCGKSTLLRCLDRMNDLVPHTRVHGSVRVLGEEVYAPGVDVEALRRRVGMVFQRPNPFPLSVFDNVAYGPRVHGLRRRDALAARVEASLRRVGLWDALADRLGDDALALSPEQQQRLCVARMLANEPDVLLFDEPCSTLDPIATATIEALMTELGARYPVILVTHNMQQAHRVADVVAFMLLGELLEVGPTQQVFTAARDPRTADYAVCHRPPVTGERGTRNGARLALGVAFHAR